MNKALPKDTHSLAKSVFLRMLLVATLFVWSTAIGRSDNDPNSQVNQALARKPKLIGIFVKETEVGVGIPVGDVIPNSPAEKAGIKGG